VEELKVDVLDICDRDGLAGKRNLKLLKKMPGDGIVCDACTTIIGIVIDAVENGLEDAAIDALVDAACMALPQPFDIACFIAFNTSLDDIIDSIEQSFASDAICDSMGLCSAAAAGKPAVSNSRSTSRVKKVGKNAAVSVFVGKMPDDVVCDACEEIMNVIVEKVAEGGSEAAIDALVDTSCMGLPPPFDIACAFAFDASLSEIIDLIVEDSGVSSIYGHIGLCNAPAPSIRIANIPKARKFTGRKVFVKQAPADICQEVVDYVAKPIVNGTIGPALEEFVSEFCDLFP
jgi:hypothetical protein